MLQPFGKGLIVFFKIGTTLKKADSAIQKSPETILTKSNREDHLLVFFLCF